METVLVTGAGGYIGTTLVPMLLDAGYRVIAIDRFFFGRDLLPSNSQLVLVREDTRKLSEDIFADVDYVIDLAAISNDPSGELFADATWQINHVGRVHAAEIAKRMGVKRYILPSSCSIYGFQSDGVLADETSQTNPLTTYAKANLAAENGVLPLADDDFTVTVLRQATVYGFSPRMRFDLAINGMTFGAWKDKVLPLMRDGTQWRPMVHVKDTAAAQLFMLTAPQEKVSGEIFNVGSDRNCYQLGPLAQEVASVFPEDIEIEWYGDPDHRSYRVAFHKLESLGWKASLTARDGVTEIREALETGSTNKTLKTITLEWYKLLESKGKSDPLAMYGGMINL